MDSSYPNEVLITNILITIKSLSCDNMKWKQTCYGPILHWQYTRQLCFLNYMPTVFMLRSRKKYKRQVCVCLLQACMYIRIEAYSLKPIPNDLFLRNFLRQRYLLSQFLPEICWEEVIKEIFLFIFYVWPGIWTVA